GHYTEQVKRGLTISFTLFIISELIAFLSVFWAYFHSSLLPNVEIESVWPPLGIQILDPFIIPLLNTILLLSLEAFITYSHYTIIKGNRKSTILGIILTL
ncbi:cytochrome c oxidase, subunit III, partial [Fomitiporia mediterranea MF3/22]|uniref:cytochrome c oxidase, subunit III n=1 Tax=Fomitiporia mediterranea (strain MF3/22) TaxID=694068 RepID=UPI00044080F9